MTHVIGGGFQVDEQYTRVVWTGALDGDTPPRGVTLTAPEEE